MPHLKWFKTFLHWHRYGYTRTNFQVLHQIFGFLHWHGNFEIFLSFRFCLKSRVVSILFQGCHQWRRRGNWCVHGEEDEAWVLLFRFLKDKIGEFCILMILKFIFFLNYIEIICNFIFKIKNHVFNIHVTILLLI